MELVSGREAAKLTSADTNQDIVEWVRMCLFSQNDSAVLICLYPKHLFGLIGLSSLYGWCFGSGLVVAIYVFCLLQIYIM